MNIKIEHIEKSIQNAIDNKSKLDAKTLSINGFTSNRIRHLLNNLLELPNINYLEIGTYRGSTFSAVMFNNKVNSAYAIDNWSEFETAKNLVKQEFLKNTQDFLFTYFEEDAWKLDLSKIKHKINVYFYDGGHTYQDHYNALSYYYPVLDNEFIFLVDDFDSAPNWEQVEKGTRDSIKDMNLKIIYENHLKANHKNDPTTWWGGYYISILQK